jgi:hypothetical protein
VFGDISADGIDVARLRGATVIAITQGSVVRVVSSRDDGRSFAPFTVVFDHDDTSSERPGGYFPAQLLAIAGNIILGQQATAGAMSTIALVSNDYGASWHAWN